MMLHTLAGLATVLALTAAPLEACEPTAPPKLADYAAIVLLQGVLPAAEVAGAPTYFVFNHQRGYVPTFHWHVPFGDPFVGRVLIHPMLISDDQIILAVWNYDTVARGVEITLWHR